MIVNVVNVLLRWRIADCSADENLSEGEEQTDARRNYGSPDLPVQTTTRLYRYTVLAQIYIILHWVIHVYDRLLKDQ